MSVKKMRWNRPVRNWGVTNSIQLRIRARLTYYGSQMVATHSI